MKVFFELNGTTITEPINWQELAIELNYDKDNPTVKTSINQWELGVGKRTSANDGSNVANKYIKAGLTGGTGSMEGIPYKIRVEGKGNIYTVFDGYLDLSTATLSNKVIRAEATETGQIDWLNTVADSFTFEYLHKGLSLGQNGYISENDYILCPYVISKPMNFSETFMSVLSIFVISVELTSSIENLVEYISELPDYIMFGVVFAIILRIIYIILLLITVVKLVMDLFETIIQPIKYHAAMNVNLLCQRACEYLGFNFKSSILQGTYKDLVIIPPKFKQTVNEDSNGILGFLGKNKSEHEGYYKGTFGDLIRQLKIMFNGKIIIDGNDLYFERRDYNITPALYQIPPLDVEEYRFNGDEFISNVLLSFALDFDDRNTIQDYDGTAIQIQTIPISTNIRKNVLAKGFVNNSLQFALAKRKTELTKPEKILKPFFKVLDKITGAMVKVVNGIITAINALITLVNKLIKALGTIGIKINVQLKTIQPLEAQRFQSLIADRIDMIKMETDFVYVHKMAIIAENGDAKNNKLLSNHEVILNAEYLYDNYHFINNFAFENQYKLFSFKDVPFCFDDYQKVRLNNRVTTTDGKEAYLDSLKWNVYKQTADIDFRVKEVWTNNLQNIKLVPSGK